MFWRPDPVRKSDATQGGVARRIAQYLLDEYGKFPATVPSIALTGYVQAQHIDTEFYDEHYGPDAYLETHAEHMDRSHPDASQR